MSGMRKVRFTKTEIRKIVGLNIIHKICACGSVKTTQYNYSKMVLELNALAHEKQMVHGSQASQ